MTVYGYTRVSTAKQVDGFSLDAQKQKILRHAKSEGLTVDNDKWVVDEGVSGSVPLTKRPKGAALLRKAKKGDTIICAKLDRMFRSASDALTTLEELKSRGVTLHLIDIGGNCVNGIGKLVFTILSAVAEMERDRLRERIGEAKAQMRREGKYQGGIKPWGYEIAEDGELVPNQLQANYIKYMKKLRAQDMSYRKIAKQLKEEWSVDISHNTVMRLLNGRRETTVI